MLFDGRRVAVLHAAQQDLDVLTHRGAVPRRLFDTQVAASFLGYATPSLGPVPGELRLTPPKADRLTDWLHRPLWRPEDYAAADVSHLLEL